MTDNQETEHRIICAAKQVFIEKGLDGAKMSDIAERCIPVIERRMGVPLAPGMGSKIALLATGGGGFSSGDVIALAVWWGDFPKREDSMIEFITHESVHSWVLPLPEVWNEPIATYVGDLVMCDMGYPEEGLKRINAQIESARRFDPDCEAPDIRFMDEDIEMQYARERRITTIVGLFTVLAVVIALMGVFGIVLFETQHRRREVAIRKVMGATTAEILRLFNRHYIQLAVVSFVIAAPLSLWIVRRWIASFAYRTPIHWWVFAAAFVAVLLVTIGTVTFCSWRTANENPADSVKSE